MTTEQLPVQDANAVDCIRCGHDWLLDCVCVSDQLVREVSS